MPPSEKLGALLLRRGLVERDELTRALRLQARAGLRLGSNLIEIGALTESALLETLGDFHDLPTVGPERLRAASLSVQRRISSGSAVAHGVIPFAIEDNVLWLASMEPLSRLVQAELGADSAFRIKNAIAIELRILEQLEKRYQLPPSGRAKNILKALDGGPTRASSRPSTEELLLKPMAPDEGDPSWIGVPVEPGSGVGEPEEEEHRETRSVRRALDRLDREPADGGEIEILADEEEREVASEDPPSRAAAAESPDEHDVERAAQRLLDACGEAYARRAIFVVRHGRIRALLGDGSGVVPRRLAMLDLELAQSSLLGHLVRTVGRPHLQRGERAADAVVREMIEALGASADGLRLLPIARRRDVAGFLLLADPRTGADVTPPALPGLRDLLENLAACLLEDPDRTRTR